MQLDVLGVVEGNAGEDPVAAGWGFDVRLSAGQYKAILSNKIFYRQDVELEPGCYDVELIVRDRLSGKMTAEARKAGVPGRGHRVFVDRGGAEPLRRAGYADARGRRIG